MKQIILTLGAPNDEKGNLSRIATDRLECAYNLYIHNDNTRFLCTGGFGEHFNTTDQPHAYYSQQFLLRKGVKEDDFLEFAISSNTVDDFRKAKLIIEKEKPDLLMLVTSDFHMQRAKILHDIIIKYPHVAFIPAKSSLTEKELATYILHEQKAINELRKNNYVLY